MGKCPAHSPSPTTTAGVCLANSYGKRSALANAALNRKPENQIVSIEIIENKELPPDFLGGKISRLDIRAALADGTRVNIEIQLKNEYNMGRQSLRYSALGFNAKQ